MLRAQFLILCALVSLAAASRSVWDGVFTKQQAARGQSVYAEVCLKCHAENLGGGEAGPPLAGREFLERWNGKTAGNLYSVIRKTMPSDNPENLTNRQYADLVAYLFSVNEFPVGPKELDREMAALDQIRIERKR